MVSVCVGITVAMVAGKEHALSSPTLIPTGTMNCLGGEEEGILIS